MSSGIFLTRSLTVAPGKLRVKALKKRIPRLMLSPTIRVVGGKRGRRVRILTAALPRVVVSVGGAGCGLLASWCSALCVSLLVLCVGVAVGSDAPGGVIVERTLASVAEAEAEGGPAEFLRTASLRSRRRAALVDPVGFDGGAGREQESLRVAGAGGGVEPPSGPDRKRVPLLVDREAGFTSASSGAPTPLAAGKVENVCSARGLSLCDRASSSPARVTGTGETPR